MRRRLTTILIGIAALMVFSTTQAAAQKAAEADRIEMAKIERQVRKEILTLPYYGVFDAIGYEFDGKTVKLSGYVVRPLTKEDAEEAVADIEGIEKVINEIKVLPPSPSDDRIRVRIYRAIANQGGLYRYLLGANPSIRIVVNSGRVTLEGWVTYDSDRLLAETAATEIFGVLSVTNNLKVEKRKGDV